MGTQVVQQVVDKGPAVVAAAGNLAASAAKVTGEVVKVG
jgi:hypothetical protein